MSEAAAREELSVSFSLTEQDVRAFTNRFLFRQFRGMFIIPCIFAACMSCGLGMLQTSNLLKVALGQAPDPVDMRGFEAVYAAPLFVLIGVVVWRLIQWSAVSRGRKLGLFGAEHFVRIDPTSVSSRSPGIGEGTVFWRVCHRVEGTSRHIFIYLNVGAAHVIPRRAFASAAAADHFLERAKTWYEAAKRV